MNTASLPDDRLLADVLRACADGLEPAEAAAELLIAHSPRLCRGDFRDGHADTGTGIPMAPPP